MSIDFARLLDRQQVDFDPARGNTVLRGARILITGAGGSIGSDLCRRVVRAEPAAVILVERHENSLHQLLTSLQDAGAATPIVPMLTDVTDGVRVDALFAKHRPHVVFHAAAHKHVWLMQHHACEAVRNNVVGTRLVARAAASHHADRFVLVSTDKAVDPVGVMGSTKAAAEAAVHVIASEAYATRFTSVRLGNVLGSAGSVVPRFLDQIGRGGPVTVRDARATRHFLLASEAVEFIVQAAAVADREYSVWIPDVGVAMNVAALARAVIRETTGTPDAVAIAFTHLLPGEKLAESLAAHDEQRLDAGLAHTCRLRPRPVNARTASDLEALERAAMSDDEAGTLQLLSEFARAGAGASRPI